MEFLTCPECGSLELSIQDMPAYIMYRVIGRDQDGKVVVEHTDTDSQVRWLRCDECNWVDGNFWEDIKGLLV